MIRNTGLNPRGMSASFLERRTDTGDVRIRPKKPWPGHCPSAGRHQSIGIGGRVHNELRAIATYGSRTFGRPRRVPMTDLYVSTLRPRVGEPVGSDSTTDDH